NNPAKNISSEASQTITPTPSVDGALPRDASGGGGDAVGSVVTDTPAFVPESEPLGSDGSRCVAVAGPRSRSGRRGWAGTAGVRAVGPPAARAARPAGVAPRAAGLLVAWQLAPASLLLVGLAGGLDPIGVRRLAARGRRWSPARTAACAGALVAAVVATQSGIARHEDARFWVHMVQHVLLGMVVPGLLVLSAPLTLALQTGAPGTRALLRRALRSRPARVLAHPLTAWLLFGGGLVA